MLDINGIELKYGDEVEFRYAGKTRTGFFCRITIMHKVYSGFMTEFVTLGNENYDAILISEYAKDSSDYIMAKNIEPNTLRRI